MEIALTRQPAQFAARVQEFLAARIERNQLATALEQALQDARRHVSATTGPATTGRLFATGCDSATGEVVAAALRFPGSVLLATGFDDPADAQQLLRRWLAEDPAPGALFAQTATAGALTDAWRAQTGGRTELQFREALHELTAVSDPPRPADGGLRPARRDDRELLIEWMTDFGPSTGWKAPASRVAANVDRRLAAEQLFIWEDARPVSMLGHSAEVAGTVRVGPVYTPPEHRNRGYASAATATLSRHLFEGGAQRCCLFTDVANPTSNKIYASVGYVRIGDWEQHRLLRSSA